MSSCTIWQSNSEDAHSYRGRGAARRTSLCCHRAERRLCWPFCVPQAQIAVRRERWKMRAEAPQRASRERAAASSETLGKISKKPLEKARNLDANSRVPRAGSASSLSRVHLSHPSSFSGSPPGTLSFISRRSICTQLSLDVARALLTEHPESTKEWRLACSTSRAATLVCPWGCAPSRSATIRIDVSPFFFFLPDAGVFAKLTNAYCLLTYGGSEHWKVRRLFRGGTAARHRVPTRILRSRDCSAC
jgi:hypothetical protein